MSFFEYALADYIFYTPLVQFIIHENIYREFLTTPAKIRMQNSIFYKG